MYNHDLENIVYYFKKNLEIDKKHIHIKYNKSYILTNVDFNEIIKNNQQLIELLKETFVDLRVVDESNIFPICYIEIFNNEIRVLSEFKEKYIFDYQKFIEINLQYHLNKLISESSDKIFISKPFDLNKQLIDYEIKFIKKLCSNNRNYVDDLHDKELLYLSKINDKIYFISNYL